MALASPSPPSGGLVIGSFLNVVAWRLPRGESLVHPRSRCPRCGTPVSPTTTSRCSRGCCCAAAAAPAASRSRARYPLVELTTGAALRRRRAPPSDDDGRHRARAAARDRARPDRAHRPRRTGCIPNRLTGAGGRRCARRRSLALDTDVLVEQLIAARAGGGFFFSWPLAYPRGMGMGDVKLAGVLGLYLGRAVAPAIFIALVAGVARRRRGHRPQGRGRGPAQDGRAVRPVPRPRRRARASSSATGSMDAYLDRF